MLLGNLCFLSPQLCAVWENVIIHKGEMLLLWSTGRFPLKYKLLLLPEHFRILVAKDPKARRGVTILSGVNDPSLYSGGSRDVVKHWGQGRIYLQKGIHWGTHWVPIPCPIWIIKEKFLSPEKDMVAKDPEFSRMRIWSHLQVSKQDQKKWQLWVERIYN